MVNFALGNEIKKKPRRCLFPMSWNNLMNIVRLWFATDYSVAQGYSISQSGIPGSSVSPPRVEPNFFLCPKLVTRRMVSSFICFMFYFL